MSIVAAHERVLTVERVKVSNDYQIEVPTEIRETLHIEAGDVLRAEIHDGSILLIPEERSYVERFRGLHREIWEGIDPREYVRQERESWRE